MKAALAVLVALFALAFLAPLAAAQIPTEDKPLLAAERLHVGATLRYASWRTGPGAALPSPWSKEWEVGIPVAYNLNRFDLVGSGFYLTDSKLYRWTIGINVELPVWGGKVSQ